MANGRAVGGAEGFERSHDGFVNLSSLSPAYIPGFPGFIGSSRWLLCCLSGR